MCGGFSFQIVYLLKSLTVPCLLTEVVGVYRLYPLPFTLALMVLFVTLKSYSV